MQDRFVRVEVLGAPQGKGRARSTIRRNNAGQQWVGHYTPKKTEDYENLIRNAATDAMAGRTLFEGPVELKLTAIFDIPESYSKTKRSDCFAGLVYPTKKPDGDNILKSFFDGMNGIVFKDDVQVVCASFHKKYGPEAKVVATVIAL